MSRQRGVSVGPVLTIWLLFDAVWVPFGIWTVRRRRQRQEKLAQWRASLVSPFPMLPPPVDRLPRRIPQLPIVLPSSRRPIPMPGRVVPPPPPKPKPLDRSTVMYRQWLAAAPTRAGNGLAYEDWLIRRFNAAGWDLHKTPRSGDYGADLVGSDPDGQRWAIQAKAWQKPVGVHAVQEVFGAKGYYRAQRAAVISTHGFTPNAQTLARHLGVELLTLLDR